MDDKYIFIYDLWNIFSRPRNSPLYAKTLNGSDYMVACKQLNIHLTLNQQQILSQTKFNRKQWMELIQNESINQDMDKWKQLHSYYYQNIDRDNIKCTQNTLCCYQWRLPKYQSLQIELLCIGYIKQETKSFADLFIPVDIIKMCMIYVYDNNNIIQKIKNLPQGVMLKSGIFHYKSCKFYVSLTYNAVDKLRFELTWIAGPKDIGWAQFRFAFELMEKFWFVVHVNDEKDLFLDDPVCIDESLSRTQISYLDSFTFNLYITEFRTFGEDEISHTADLTEGKQYEYVPIIIDEEICQSDNCDTYQWLLNEQEMNQIKNSKPKDIIKSNIFIMHGLKFMMWLYVQYVFLFC